LPTVSDNNFLISTKVHVPKIAGLNESMTRWQLNNRQSTNQIKDTRATQSKTEDDEAFTMTKKTPNIANI
jgi:hypothetical protein